MLQMYRLTVEKVRKITPAPVWKGESPGKLQLLCILLKKEKEKKAGFIAMVMNMYIFTCVQGFHQAFNVDSKCWKRCKYKCVSKAEVSCLYSR